MIAILWTLPACPGCKDLKQFLISCGQYKTITIHDVERAKDIDAMAEVYMEQGGDFPLLHMDGRRIPPEEYKAMIVKWKEAGCPNNWPHAWEA